VQAKVKVAVHNNLREEASRPIEQSPVSGLVVELMLSNQFEQEVAAYGAQQHALKKMH
jgi:hypothetical protein